MANNIKLSEVEIIKEGSNYLRGTLKESLANETTGAINPQDSPLIRFHGTYQQYDRDLESERKRQKLEPLYSFMVRVRLPGGVATPEQWLIIDELADKYANSTFKLTTRQAFQFHGVLKRNLKKTIREINEALMDTIAACGDVNRNVMSNANPAQSPIYLELDKYATLISQHLTPQTSAYHEIWLDQKLLSGGEPDIEPVYGKTYLPRKFKIALALPPYNDTDIFANDLGLIGITENDRLIGFNVAVGGGMGTTFGDKQTYPRLGTVIGFIPKEKVVDVAEKVVITQRDLGNRSERRYARLKYTIDRLGVEKFKEELFTRLGYTLDAPKPFEFTQSGDQFGWLQSKDGKWHLTLFIEGGRVKDSVTIQLRTAFRKIAKIHKGEFRLTGNQNLVIANVEPDTRAAIIAILAQHGIISSRKLSGARRNSLACVALNTCSLAFAEAERYLPSLLDKIDILLKEAGLEDEPIIVRMTGCPNGCARPFLGEIGFVGKAPGRYNLYLGAGFAGDRLNSLYRENLDEQQILSELKPILKNYSQNRLPGERFGDFVFRNT